MLEKYLEQQKAGKHASIGELMRDGDLLEMKEPVGHYVEEQLFLQEDMGQEVLMESKV